jgi:hypothetical protein
MPTTLFVREVHEDATVSGNLGKRDTDLFSAIAVGRVKDGGIQAAKLYAQEFPITVLFGWVFHRDGDLPAVGVAEGVNMT